LNNRLVTLLLLGKPMGKSFVFFFFVTKISVVLEDITVNRDSTVKMHLGASIMCNNFLKTAREKIN
jgi:hypothetical protein